MSSLGLSTPGTRQSVSVIGGSGFIGTCLVGKLLDHGLSVRIGDINSSKSYPDLWAECDVRNGESVRELCAGADVIVNLAAEHRDDVHPISRYYEVNVEGAIQVCKAARECGVSKIVFTSSVAIYGFQPRPVDENGPFEPFNHYGRTKLDAEKVYRAWAEEDTTRSLIIVRPSVVFGEGNRGNVYNLLRQIATGKFLMVGSGQNIKSMAYVGNVAAFLDHAVNLGPGVQIFNYADGPDMNTKDLVAHIRQCLGKPGNPPSIPKPIAMTGGRLLDLVARASGRTFPISAIRVRKFCESTQVRADRLQQTGFTPPYSLRDGLTRAIQSEFQQSRESSDAIVPANAQS